MCSWPHSTCGLELGFELTLTLSDSRLSGSTHSKVVSRVQLWDLVGSDLCFEDPLGPGSQEK